MEKSKYLSVRRTNKASMLLAIIDSSGGNFDLRVFQLPACKKHGCRRRSVEIEEGLNLQQWLLTHHKNFLMQFFVFFIYMLNATM